MPQDNISPLTVTSVLSVCALQASGFPITFFVFAEYWTRISLQTICERKCKLGALHIKTTLHKHHTNNQ